MLAIRSSVNRPCERIIVFGRHNGLDLLRALGNHAKVRVQLHWVLVFLLLLTSAAGAEPAPRQSIEGLISQDTHWTLSDSPVLVSGNLSIVDGAQLRIDPGVIVGFGHGVALEVIAGSIYARGTSASPISFISQPELDGEASEPGYWGSIILGSGTVDAATLFEHAYVRHGHGIQIVGSSPQLNHLHLEFNAGAAIDLDLKSSPHGVGLTATGNALNGIRVPAGRIGEDVVWALRGIPYVLEQGRIKVGRAPFALLPQQLTVVRGVQAQLELYIPASENPNPLVVDLSSSVPGVATVPMQLPFEPGSTSASFLLEAVSPGQSTVSASHAEFGLTTAQVEVIEPPQLSLSPATASIGIDQEMPFQIILSAPAGVGGLPIAVSASPEGVLDFPDHLFLPEGASSEYFLVSGLSQGESTLQLSADGYSGVIAQIEVVPPSIQLPLTTFTSPGIARLVPLGLSHPAPEGGLQVELSASVPGLIQLPESVFVPEGSREAEFEIEGLSNGSVWLTASASGFANAEIQVTVAELVLSLDPNEDPWLPVGVERQYAIRLSDAAPPGGLVVSVALEDQSVAAVDKQSLFIPAGQIQTTEALLISGLAVGNTELVLGVEGGQQVSYPVEVTEMLELRLSRSAVTIGRGLASYPWVLQASLWSGELPFRPYNDFVVPLQCAEHDVCLLHQPLVIQSGIHSAPVRLRGTGLGQTHMTIDAPTLSLADEMLVTVVEPELAIQGLSSTRSVGSARDTGNLRWFVPGGTSSNYSHSTMPEDTAVHLAIVNDDPPGIIDGIWSHATTGQQITEILFQAGQNVSPQFHVGSPVADGSYQVRALIPDLVESLSEETVVMNPELVFGISSMVAGRGLVSAPWVLTVERRAGGLPINGSEALEVDIACVDSSVCDVPATVTIPANQHRVSIPLTGVGLGVTEIVASASGHLDAEPASITVVDPSLTIELLSYTRSIGSARDDARFHWHVPGGTSSNAWGSTMAETSEVVLSIVEDEPEGLIDGFWSHQTAGEPIETFVFSHGINRTSRFYVGTPSQSGTYRVHAQIDGLAEVLSDEILVESPSLSFNRTSMVTGRGLISADSVLQIRRMVDGSGFNGAEPLEVFLNCVDEQVCMVPESVTIPANWGHVNVPVQGVASGITTIVASALDHESAEPAEIEVVEPELRFESLADIRTVGSARDFVRLRWHVPGGTTSNAPWSTMAEDKQVELAVADADPAGLVDGIWSNASGGSPISQLTFFAGQNRSDAFYIGTPQMTGSYRVAAEITGLVSGQSDVQLVVMPRLQFSLPEMVAGLGMTSNAGHLIIRRVAETNVGNTVLSATAQDVIINLSCSASEVCSTPQTVTLPAGSNQISIPLTGTGQGATTLQASAIAHLPADPLPVTTHRPRIVFSNLATSMTAGSQQSFRLRLQVEQSQLPFAFSVADPFLFDLTSNFPSVLNLLQEAATISSGNTSPWLGVEALSVGSAQITVSGSGLDPVTSSVVEVSP